MQLLFTLACCLQFEHYFNELGVIRSVHKTLWAQNIRQHGSAFYVGMAVVVCMLFLLGPAALFSF